MTQNPVDQSFVIRIYVVCRLNSAHWPNKENRQFLYFLIFRAHAKTGLGWPGMASNGGGSSPPPRLIQTLPTCWVTRILILAILNPLIFVGPKFLAWAQLGPTHLGPAWAHPLWAQLGPTLVAIGMAAAQGTG